MGYYTHHRLSSAPEDIEDTYATTLAEISGYDASCFDRYGSGETCKWYDHESDMIELSKVFPEVRFRLDGRGEGDNDLWVEWYHDGKRTGKWRMPDPHIPAGFDPPADCRGAL